MEYSACGDQAFPRYPSIATMPTEVPGMFCRIQGTRDFQIKKRPCLEEFDLLPRPRLSGSFSEVCSYAISVYLCGLVHRSSERAGLPPFAKASEGHLRLLLSKFLRDQRLSLWTCPPKLGTSEGGAGEGNRTLVCSLGSYRSTIELHPREGGYSQETTARRFF